MFGSPETTTGGKALKFYASVRIDVRRIETLKDGTDAVGNRTRAKIVKNKVAPPFKQAEFDIIYGQGISREGSLVDMGVEHGIVRKSGAWYTYDGDQLGQGKENARAFLRDNPDLADEIEKRIKEKLGIGAVLDAPASRGDARPGPGRPVVAFASRSASTSSGFASARSRGRGRADREEAAAEAAAPAARRPGRRRPADLPAPARVRPAHARRAGRDPGQEGRRGRRRRAGARPLHRGRHDRRRRLRRDVGHLPPPRASGLAGPALRQELRRKGVEEPVIAEAVAAARPRAGAGHRAGPRRPQAARRRAGSPPTSACAGWPACSPARATPPGSRSGSCARRSRRRGRISRSASTRCRASTTGRSAP